MNENPEATKSNLLEELLNFKDTIMQKYNVDCLVFSVAERNTKHPVVVFDGDEIQRTALSVSVAREMRQRVINQIDGTR